VDLLEGLLKDAAPDESAVDRSAATYMLFGMMKLDLQLVRPPRGEIDPERLAELIARTFIGGFAEARSTVSRRLDGLMATMTETQGRAEESSFHYMVESGVRDPRARRPPRPIPTHTK